MDGRPKLVVTAIVLGCAIVLLSACKTSGTAQVQTATGTAEATRSASASGTASKAAEATLTLESTVTANAKQDIANTMKATPGLSQFTTLTAGAGLLKTLHGKGPYTIFVPSNAAISSLPSGTLETLLSPNGIKQLRVLIRYHLIKGAVPTGQMVTLRKLLTYEGSKIAVTSKGSTVILNGKVKITQADIKTKNGYIDVIGAELMPPGFKP